MKMNEMMFVGLAVAPLAQGTTDTNGVTIVRPWEKGRSLSFIAIGAALAASDSITWQVQARRSGTSTWDNVKESDGTTNLVLGPFVDAGPLENGAVLGSLDLSRLKSGTNLNSAYTYDAIRLVGDNTNNSSPGIVGVAYVITDLYEHASGQSDGLIYKQLPITDPDA